MKKYPRQKVRRTGFRTVIFAGRRGGAVASEASTGIGDQTFYVASVPGGKADLEWNFVAGVAQTPTILTGRSLDLFSYASGVITAFSAGYGWNGAGVSSTPYLHRVSEENFESYGLGGITQDALTNGTGWNGSAVLSAY